ncbi:hypothetical protein DYB25_004287 [Aphanomyces astaci]|uniref:JmjC domain-containing protein n=1 Tax=Aphanomyces astaci TaxID=112090 RepID=A0A397DFK0_APHAT|nr:hypothetical protein DYB25_004287 [Aphanomyces astaci]RHY41280.1 hypothetical protein DYB30_006986 [Aphanomyces astaci]RHY64404.1 hypothetical protein DYB38_003372 [Aphanomyces astaci]RHY73115.1 hypothetical protein DYB34_001691 [Aphanomyces astaci]
MQVVLAVLAVVLSIVLEPASASLSLALNASCHTFVYRGSPGPLMSEFLAAKAAFHDESAVCFQQDVDLLRQSTAILYYPRHDAHAAKSCLLRGLPSAETYSGPVSAVDLVAFVNQRAHTHRLPDGQINPLASIARALESQLFTVPATTSSCKTVAAHDMTPELFEQFILRNEPLIIQRAAPELVNATEWSTQSLLERIGSRQVHVKVSPTGDFEGCEPLAWWEGANDAIPDFVLQNLESPDRVLVRPAAANMAFSSFVSRLTTALPSTTSYYLEYLSMATYVPELLTNAPQFPWATSSFLQLDVANLWFGDGKSVGKLHFDAYENLMTMVSGQKQFVLYDPSDNTRLYEGHIREAQYEMDASGDGFYRRKLMESTSMVNSPVDINDPADVMRYPRFAQANALRCTVNEGDTLFVPSFWWHEVISTPATHEARNVAVNYWYKPLYTKDFPCKSCRVRFNLAYEHVLRSLQSKKEEQSRDEL